MSDVKTHRQLWGTDFPINGEWDAKNTPPHTLPEKAGRWTLRREAERFVVVFHSFKDGSENLLAEYPTTEAGELDAKRFALTTEKK
jgi:hypothetical protein